VRQLAGGEPVGGEEREHARHAIGERGRHLLAMPGAASPHERGEDPHRRVRAGDHVRDRRRGAHPGSGWIAVHAHEAAHRLRDEVERRAVGVRAVETEAGHVAAHEVGLDRPQRVAPEAHPVHHARAVVVDHDVRPGEQPAEHLLRLVGAEIERDRALIAVEGGEVERVAVARGTLRAHRVALAGRLHLDDLRPHVREEHRAERPGDDARQIDDADAFELHASRAGRGYSSLTPDSRTMRPQCS
jgi:hypothetical protein